MCIGLISSLFGGGRSQLLLHQYQLHQLLHHPQCQYKQAPTPMPEAPTPAPVNRR